MSLGGGNFPDIVGTIPEVLDESGNVLNPVPSSSQAFAGAGWLGLFGPGVSTGLTSWADVGLSFARGLDATARLLRLGPASLSVSPAYYRYTNDPDSGSPEVWSRVTNLNATALVSYRPELGPYIAIDAWGGPGISRYTVEIKDQWRSFTTSVPSASAGLALETFRRDATLLTTLRLSFTGTGTWLEQRDGRRDVVVSKRFEIALRTWPAW
jgi:hypothetical protein